jgi:hypothetical protein
MSNVTVVFDPYAPAEMHNFGNHDNAGRLALHDRASLYEWFIELGTYRNIITDGSTRKLENLVLTTIPGHCSRQEKSIWLDRGSKIRRQTGMPWIVLHHCPTKTGAGFSGDQARESSGLPHCANLELKTTI